MTMPNEHDVEKITWPVINFSKGYMFITLDQADWGDSNVLGVLSHWYENLEFIDSTGKIFSLKEVSMSSKITIFDRLFSFIINRSIKVKIEQYELKSKISLADFKTLVCKQIDKEEAETQIWSERPDFETLQDDIQKCTNYEEVMRLIY